ncbi:TPA: CAAX amino terminal protease [Bacillus toyonensis]|nr:CAAX amino terminal protease [Bacillus toyonensis]
MEMAKSDIELSKQVKKHKLLDLTFNFEEANHYLQSVVQTKKLYQLLLLILISFILIYTPLWNFLYTNLFGETSKYVKAMLQSCFYTIPIAIPFFWIFRFDIQKIFKKFTLHQYKKTWWIALYIIFIIMFVALTVSTITSFEFATNQGFVGERKLILFRIFVLFIQLFGENLIFISLLLGCYKLLQYVTSHERTIIIISFLLASIIFGILHLPTYNFNLIQCIFFIGIPALPHLIVFVKYQNAHMGYWVHLNYDLMLLVLVLL